MNVELVAGGSVSLGAAGGARHVEMVRRLVSVGTVIELVALLQRMTGRGRPALGLRATRIHWIDVVVAIVVVWND